jgi:RNA polymerase sigma factor (sigma-70 family)
VDARSNVIENRAAAELPEFESLFHQHYAPIHRVIARIVGDGGCAEELAIDVFLTFLRNPHVHGEKAGGWLYRTAVRRGIYELRRRARHARYAHFFSRAAAQPANPEQMQAAAQEQDHVRKVLAALKPRESELLLLRADDRSYEEIAGLLEVSPASVGALLGRAQKSFRKEYTKNYGEPRKHN